MLRDFKIISGFSDTLVVFKKMLPERKGPSVFKFETLVNDFLKPNTSGNFHDALFDTTALKELVSTFNAKDNLFTCSKTYQEYFKHFVANRNKKYGLQFLTELNKVISPSVLEKLCLNNITFASLVTTFNNEGENGITKMLTETVENKKPKVTKTLEFQQK